MRTTQSLNVTLPADMAQLVKDKVASGEYATESEVISDGLRFLAAQDTEIEKWLIDDVVPVYDEMKLRPERALSAEDVQRRLDARVVAAGSKHRDV